MATVEPLLRVRGGISGSSGEDASGGVSSPRARRYFLYGRYRRTARRLFSACAEVFPTQPSNQRRNTTLLRVRGGISPLGNESAISNDSSPRARRYFRGTWIDPADQQLFSACAEVFPLKPGLRKPGRTLLRVRGGISKVRAFLECGITSSPRARRYFLGSKGGAHLSSLFSACAEVFPKTPRLFRKAKALLRVRGGISALIVNPVDYVRSSPRARRYFRRGHRPRCWH